MRKTNFMRSLKRRALPLLTSVAMAMSMLSGTGVTAMAADANVIARVNFYKEGATEPFDPHFVAEKNITTGMLNNKLASLSEAFGLENGYKLTWEEYNGIPGTGGVSRTGRIFNPSVDTYGNVATYTTSGPVNTYYLNAVVEKKNITIKYELDGGRWVSAAPTTAKRYSEELIIANNPVKEKYDFAGWKAGNGAKGAKDRNLTTIIDENCTWNDDTGSITLTALWTKNNDTLTDQYDLAAEQSKLAVGKVDDAEKAAAAAKEAAAAADKAAKAANDNPTADTAAAARKAAETAKAAAENATKAYSEAETACNAAFEAYENFAGDYAAAAGNGAYIDPELTSDKEELNDILEELADDRDAAKTETTKQAAAANKAAENALAAATEADKNDGSEPGKLAPVGSELKDANGEYTGYVVTNADPSNPEVEYVATDADKKAKKISLPEKVKDRSGNEYNVTSIAAKALERADVKEIIIPKSVKKIGDKAFYKSKAKKITIKTTKKGKIKIGDKAFRVKPDKAKIRVKGAKGKYKDKIVKHVKKNAKKTADVK